MKKPIKRAAVRDRNPSESFLSTEGSLYRRRGKPERAWAEIRRAIFRKLHSRIQKERLLAVSAKDRSPDNKLNTENETKHLMPD
jgi:hypothetical protein